MKHWIFTLSCWYLLWAGGNSPLVAQSQTQSKMLMTKHNLGTSGTGTIKATTENDICVFCHTPHVPREYAALQLWNHKSSSADYTLYSSEYLTSLNYAAPNQPNLRSKLCLSCHDGTIAIGEVYNNEGMTSITMQNNVTTMPTTSPGNLGTSLANDHPVGFIFDNTKDPELVTRTFPWKTPVKLDPDAASGTVECITCHDPHDNTNTKFLRMDNTDAALCGFCHEKTGWNNSIHKKSTQAFTAAGSTLPTTVGEWACRSCHQSHGGAGSPYLLKESEEQTCFTSGCHGSTATGVNTKNIQSEYEKQFGHPTISDATEHKHKNPDNDSTLSKPNRHAECQDCHNSHQAKKGLHTVGSNTASEVLKGVRGYLPNPTLEWTQPLSFVETYPSTEENQICFKCHSSKGLGELNKGVTDFLGPSGDYITDQAMEFNPQNHSTHPVRSPISSPLTDDQVTSAWTPAGTKTMYCSDCHGNDIPTSTSVPQGPHASNAKFMLTGNAKYWPKNASDVLWSLDDIKQNRNNWQSNLFCVNCHQMYNGISFTNKVHDAEKHQYPEVKCITCHVTVPHGSKRSRLIGYVDDVKPYNYLGSGVYDKLVIEGFEKAAPNLYEKKNCSMNGVCHFNQSGNYEP